MALFLCLLLSHAFLFFVAFGMGYSAGCDTTHVRLLRKDRLMNVKTGEVELQVYFVPCEEKTYAFQNATFTHRKEAPPP